MLFKYEEKQLSQLSLVFPKSHFTKFKFDSVTTEKKSSSNHKSNLLMESKSIKDFNYNSKTKQTNFIK